MQTDMLKKLFKATRFNFLHMSAGNVRYILDKGWMAHFMGYKESLE